MQDRKGKINKKNSLKRPQGKPQENNKSRKDNILKEYG